MSWNYRVVKRTSRSVDYFAIYEVYYDEDGQPNGITSKAVAAGGETLEELRADFDMQRQALNREVLDWEDFESSH